MDFQPGQPVKVKLSRKYDLIGETVDHAAKFVRYHEDREGRRNGWAEVELERAHSQHKIDGAPVRQLMVPLSVISTLLLLLFLLACPAQAQEPGTVSLNTVYAKLANNVTCTGSPQTFVPQNLGQVAHQANAFSNVSGLTLEIDGSDGVTQYRMSSPAVSFANGGFTSYVATGSGAYANILVVVTCTAGGSFTLTYAGAQTPFSSLQVGPAGGSPQSSGSIASQVQGVVAQNGSGSGVNPIIDGALQLPVNQSFLNVGIDNFTSSSLGIPVGAQGTGTFTIGTVPRPTQSNELAIAFDSNENPNTTTSVPAPWVSLAANGGQWQAFSLSNPVAGQPFQRNYGSGPTCISGPCAELLSIVVVQTPGVTVRSASYNQTTGAPSSQAYAANTLAGSLLIAAFQCTANTTPCAIASVADTQSHTWVQATAVSLAQSANIPAQSVWIATTTSSAAADTVTPTMATGTLRSIAVVEVPAITTASINQPAISVAADPIGTQVVRQDAQAPNQWTCTVTLTTNTTSQCEPAPTTINNVPVRAYVTDFQINTTTAGTATTIQIKDGTAANCGTNTANLSAITYPNTAVGLTSIFGMRTPLIAPLQSAVCATQAGTTAGTSVVEIHGFFAP